MTAKKVEDFLCNFEDILWVLLICFKTIKYVCIEILRTIKKKKGYLFEFDKEKEFIH